MQHAWSRCPWYAGDRSQQHTITLHYGVQVRRAGRRSPGEREEIGRVNPVIRPNRDDPVRTIAQGVLDPIIEQTMNNSSWADIATDVYIPIGLTITL